VKTRFTVRAWSAATAACALILASASLAASVAPPKGLSINELEGKVGPYVVGMNLKVRDHVEVESGHYFYASKLLDIPLKAHVQGENVTLEEPGGGVFHLHFVTNSAEKGQALNFYTSTGLEGSWTRGDTTLPVVLQFSTVYDNDDPAERGWYADVTSEPDAAFERRVQTFLRAVVTGDRRTAAQGVSYPLRVGVKGPRPLVIRTQADLLANWDRIFTPKLVARLRDALPHEMFVHNGQAMVLNGRIWFDAKGASGIDATN
jgi:hypothetical protein